MSDASGPLGEYVYDGDGRRVKKKSAAEETIFVYDAAGKEIAEYSTSLNPTPQTSYLTADNLGTPRINTDQTGAVISRHDYQPYGEEIATPERNAGLKYQDDAVRKQFTGYERDEETDLDYAQARMYSKNQGRFTTADQLLNSGHPMFAQSWNRYIYVTNNPLILSDPTGFYICTAIETNCKKFDAALDQAKENLAKIEGFYTKDSDEYRDAERAISVYGDKGVDNGVEIAGTKKDLGPGAAYTETSGVKVKKTDDNPLQQRIRITISQKTFDSSSLSGTIAHEGSHAADGSDWVKSGFLNAKNPTNYQTEFKAYKISSLFAQAAGKNEIYHMDLTPQPKNLPIMLPIATLWNTSWSVADNLKFRDSSIERFLTNEKFYARTLNVKAFQKGVALK